MSLRKKQNSFLLHFRNELWLASFVQKECKISLMSGQLSKCFENLNQYFYHKFGMECALKILKKDQEREKQLKDKIQKRAFTYSGIKHIDAKLKRMKELL